MLATLIEWAEEAIRSGATSEVSHRLSLLNLKAIPRESLLTVANLCRRCGLVAKGLRLLEPVVYDSRTGWLDGASCAEQAEYGALLWKTGATSEALKLLQKIDEDREPNTLLYQAYCHFTHWDQDQAAHCLRTYLEKPLSSYHELLGQVNLAAALLTSGSLEEAGSLLEKSIHEAKGKNSSRLLANLFEMRAQIHISNNDFVSARTDLEAAADQLGNSNVWDLLFIRKWQAYMEAVESGQVNSLKKVRQEAIVSEHWETVRDCDLQALRITFDEEIFDQLYFGTRSLGFRERLIRTVAHKAESSTFTIGNSSGAKFHLYLASAEISTNNGVASIPPNTNRLLAILHMDLYKPLSLGEIFMELYPDDHFNVFSSPKRVHQMISRTRKWLNENQIPIELKSDAQTRYSVKAAPSVAITKTETATAAGINEAIFERLQRRIPADQVFLASEMRQELDIPTTSFQRFLQWAAEHRLVLREGNGRNTRYRRCG